MIAQIIAERIRNEIKNLDENNDSFGNLRTFFVAKGIKRVCKALYRQDKSKGFVKTHYKTEQEWLNDCGFPTEIENRSQHQ